MKKHLWIIRAASLFLTACSAGMMLLPVAAVEEQQTDTVYLCDEAEQLSESEFANIMEELEETAEYTGMNIGVCIGGSPMGESATIAFCDDTYDELFGINTDGVFLYLDLSGEYDLFDYISTSGKGQFYYSNSEEYDRISDIFSDMNSYLSRGEEDVPGAISEFCFDLKYYVDRGAPSKYYYTYNSDSDMYLIMEDGEVKEVSELPADYTASMSWGQIALVALAIGLLMGVISVFSIRYNYRFKKAGDMQNYLESGRVHFTVRRDQFLREHISRTRISSDSSSGGGGGGGHSHSSSSGGSHGGGGNHR